MRIKVFFVFLFASLKIISFAQEADDIIGTWTNEKQDKTIKIYRQDDLYYGKILWLKDSEKGKGDERVDLKNKNEALRNRKIVGINYLLSFTFFSERKVWKEGQIYNYETGNTYSGKIHLINENELELTGFYGILWFLGRTKTWTRTTTAQN